MLVSRRGLLGTGVWALAGGKGGPTVRVRTLTKPPHHHFYGYYGIPPWNRSGTKLACLESTFQDHVPRPEEPASIGLVDAKTGAFKKIGETLAWNFQQGSMMNWNPLAPDKEVILNDRRDGEIVSAVIDVGTGKKRHLPRAINGVSPNGRWALCLTYGRLTRLRPVVGYVGAIDPHPSEPHPDDDGVFVMDLRNGEHKLAVSIGEVFRRLVKAHPELEGKHMWFNHTVFNRNSTRFFFLARTWKDTKAGDPGPGKRLESAMFTANTDGSDLREVVPFGKGISHFEWRNDTEILATFRLQPDRMQHVLFTDGKADYRVVGDGVLLDDGHCSFAPDANWIVTDRNHFDTLEKSLHLFDLKTGHHIEVGRFPMKDKEFLGGDRRCDLHPRWNRRGDAVCFDALETATWTRQLHLAELGKV